MTTSLEKDVARGLLQFEAQQREFQIGSVRVGGQPGSRPTVLIGSIFYHGHKIIIDEDRGRFDRDEAEQRIRCAGPAIIYGPVDWSSEFSLYDSGGKNRWSCHPIGSYKIAGPGHGIGFWRVASVSRLVLRRQANHLRLCRVPGRHAPPKSHGSQQRSLARGPLGICQWSSCRA